MLKVHSAQIGSYLTNCYIVTDTESGLSAAIDCALYNDDYIRFINKTGVTELKYILLTHGHFDHVCGVNGLKKAFGGEVCICTKDSRCLKDERYNLNNLVGFSQFLPVEADRLLCDGDKITLGKTTITVICTPGHTPGSCCFDTGKILFSGDTLFKGSMGRTDFPRGNEADMHLSLQKLAALNGDRIVYPGHSQQTNLNYEIQTNPYIN